MSERQYPDMWVDPEDDPRHTGEGQPHGERAVLVAYLERYRTTLRMKCDDLDAEQMARWSVPPSSLSLLGLVRHLARVEQHWFRRVLEGRHELSRLFEDEEAGFAFGDVDDDLVASAWADWEQEVAHAREVLAGVELDALVDHHGEQVEVRDVVVHMIEEYARHCGHADLLRECIDGRTGQ